MDWQAIALTARLAAIVSVILLIISLPLAHWLTFSRRRWTFLVESIVSLPLVLPPTVLGFYLLMAHGLAQPDRAMVDGVDGTPARLHLRRSRDRVGPLQPAVRGAAGGGRVRADRSEPARSVRDAWRIRRFERSHASRCRCRLKASSPALVLSFAHTVGEFGVVLMVGGNLPGITRTVSISIYDHVQALEYQQANQTALVLLAFSMLVLMAVYGLRRRPWAAAPIA